MKEYVHLKDKVVFAHHKSENDVDDSSEDVIEVTGDLDSYLNMKYENGTFAPAPLLRFAILDEKNNNTVVGINKSYFLSDAGNNIVIDNPEVEVLWTWDGTKFYPPVEQQQHVVEYIDSMPITTSRSIPMAPMFSKEELSKIEAPYQQLPSSDGSQNQ